MKEQRNICVNCGNHKVGIHCFDCIGTSIRDAEIIRKQVVKEMDTHYTDSVWRASETREKNWNRDYSSLDNYLLSVNSNRINLINLMGGIGHDIRYWFNEEIILARAWFSANFYQTKRDNTRLLKVNVDGSGFSSLFKKKHFKKLPWLPSFQAGIVDFLPEDDDNILVEVDISNYRFPSIVKLNVKKNTISEVRKPKTDVVSWETDRSGKARIGYKYNDIKNNQS